MRVRFLKPYDHRKGKQAALTAYKRGHVATFTKAMGEQLITDGFAEAAQEPGGDTETDQKEA